MTKLERLHLRFKQRLLMMFLIKRGGCCSFPVADVAATCEIDKILDFRRIFYYFNNIRSAASNLCDRPEYHALRSLKSSSENGLLLLLKEITSFQLSSHPCIFSIN